MSARVDQLEKDMATLKRLAWACVLCSAAGLVLRIAQVAGWLPSADHYQISAPLPK